MSSLLVILFGVVKQFWRFWIWSETECKTPAEYGVCTAQFHTPPPSHSLYVKHNAAKSVNRSILKKSRHKVFGVFIVHSSMVYLKQITAEFSPILNLLTLLPPPALSFQLDPNLESNRKYILSFFSRQQVFCSSVGSLRREGSLIAHTSTYLPHNPSKKISKTHGFGSSSVFDIFHIFCLV